MAVTEDQIQGLIDRQAILDQITNYARSVDRLDHLLGHAVFHPDAPADYGSLYQGTGHGFIDWCIAAHHDLLSHSHQFSNISIAIAGDTARSETYADVTVRWRGADGGDHVQRTLGRYVDRWERRGDGVWRIAHRHYVHDMDHGGPVEADSHPMTGRRDRLDASYFPAGSAPA